MWLEHGETKGPGKRGVQSGGEVDKLRQGTMGQIRSLDYFRSAMGSLWKFLSGE